MKSEAKKSVRNKALMASPVKGATPRAYETHPKASSGKTFRGTEVKLKAGKKL